MNTLDSYTRPSPLVVESGSSIHRIPLPPLMEVVANLQANNFNRNAVGLCQGLQHFLMDIANMLVRTKPEIGIYYEEYVKNVENETLSEFVRWKIQQKQISLDNVRQIFQSASWSAARRVTQKATAHKKSLEKQMWEQRGIITSVDEWGEERPHRNIDTGQGIYRGASEVDWDFCNDVFFKSKEFLVDICKASRGDKRKVTRYFKSKFPNTSQPKVIANAIPGLSSKSASRCSIEIRKELKEKLIGFYGEEAISHLLHGVFNE